MVCVREHHHGPAGVEISNGCVVCGGHAAVPEPHDVHVQHALRVQVRVAMWTCGVNLPWPVALRAGRARASHCVVPALLWHVVWSLHRCDPALTCVVLVHPRSIMYKTRLPFVIAFNKVDAQPCDFAMEWMEDFEAFQVRMRAVRRRCEFLRIS